jgi:ATP-dependent exoDNAse (exonuclease V) alpha subunit
MAIVEMARDGVGRYSPLGRSYSFEVNELAPDQLRAFRQILGSTDFITLFRGGAGTGKSFVLRRVQDALRRAGHVTQAAAPQRQQVIDLDRNGLQEIETVAEFILRGALPRGARTPSVSKRKSAKKNPQKVVIVDEAGQIGGQQMLDLLRLVKEANGRVILSGDTRQHGPVEVSDALRAIERYGGLRPAQLDQIRRQDPVLARKAEERESIAIYRKAVEAASAGDLIASLEHLERLGVVKECGIDEQSERLTEAYLGFVGRGETAIVVSQTRAEVRAINEAVCAGLRRCGALRGADTNVTALEQIDLTDAQKADAPLSGRELHCIQPRVPGMPARLKGSARSRHTYWNRCRG